jgi:hypothetical protein
MTDTERPLIIASQRDVPKFEMNALAKEAKQNALSKSALIAKVTDRDSKILAVRAQQELKRVLNDIEKARKQLKEPLLAAGRQLDTLCAAESLELDKEFARVSGVVKEFDDAERQRVLEEERLQRDELARIEREAIAERKRIANELEAKEARIRAEQAEIERKAREVQETEARKVREEREAAEKLANEATTRKQREAAERARKEAAERARKAQDEAERSQAAAKAEKERQEALLAQERASAEAAQNALDEKTGDAVYAAGRPVEMTTVAGQRQRTDWQIIVEQPFVLAKFHPDLVDIKPRLSDIKNALNEGREVKGIKAERVHISGVRLPSERKAIEV